MDPFTNNPDEHPNLPDNDFALSHDGTLSNMLDQGLFHMDSTDFSNIPRQSIESANISSIKQQIISHDSLLRELEKLRQYKHDLEQENEKYKDEVVELRQKVAQNNSASSLNKLQEQINHYKALNEQLMQRVHNAEKELDNKNSQEPDKKSVKALKRDLQMKEEELATNRRLLEDSYNTLKKYKERLQNTAKNLPPSSSVGISSSKSSQSMITEEKLEEGSWKERVLDLQDKVIGLQGQLSEQNSIRHRLELELNEFRTENRMLKEGGRGDFQKREEKGGTLFEERMKETIAREGKDILEGLLKNYMKGNGENLMQVSSSSPEKEKVKKDKRKKTEGEKEEKEEKKKKRNKEKKEEVKSDEGENRVLDSSFEKIEKKIKGENEEILERNENKEEKQENMREEFNDEDDDDDLFGDFLDSVNQETGGVDETNNQEFGAREEKEVQSFAEEERKEGDEIEVEEKEQKQGKIEEEPINDNYEPEKEVGRNEIISEEPIMNIEEPETLVKEQSQPENIQQESEQCKEDLEQLNQRVQSLLVEKKKKSRSELVENSFELLLRLYLCRFEAPKYFAQEDMKYSNQRHELIEILIQALDTEDLSDIATKLIDIFVQLAKSYRLFSIAYAFWELVQDFSNFNSSKTVLNNLAGALYNFLFLPYISKKEREGFNTQLQDLNLTEKRHYLSFLKDILNIPLDNKVNEENFSGLEKLNIFEGNPLKAMLLVVVLSIYQVCNKPLLVLEIVIDLISYQFSDPKSRCNLLFVALAICWKFLRTNLSQPCDKFIIKSSTLHYLFNLKFLALAEDHPNISNLDFVFTAIKMSVLIAFDKLPQEDFTQTLKLEILVNKFIEKIDHIPVSRLDQDFENWLPTIYRTEKFKNLDFQNTVPLKNIYIDPSKPAISCLYNFIMTILDSLLEAEKCPLSNDNDPSELYLEVNFSILDIMIGLHILSSCLAQTEWCDLAVSKGLMKYIETATGSLQKVLAIIGTGLFLPNIGNEEVAESIKEKLIRIVTSKGEGENNMYDVVASFGVLANYDSEDLKENLEEVRLDERVVSYLDKDALDLYYNQ